MILAHGHRRRLRWERSIWAVDLIAYGLTAISGGFALFHTSEYVERVVIVDWVIVVWGFLLLVGGGLAFAGRLLRLWVIEHFANVWASAGVLLYAIILVPAVLEGASLALLGCVVIAWLFVLRRHLELKILTSEPGLNSFRKRLDAALKRRTENIVATRS
jgi:hypothetical protein